MDIYKNKIAYLTSLLVQIEKYPESKHYSLLEVKDIKELLDMPEVADRDWINDNTLSQKSFLHFLDTHITIYESVLKELKEKG